MFFKWLALGLLSQGGGEAPAQGIPFLNSPYFLIVAIVAMFYFVMYRPEKKRKEERERMLKALDKGDDVVTAGGIQGRIVGAADDLMTVEIAPNVKIKIGRQYLSPPPAKAEKKPKDKEKDKQ